VTNHLGHLRAREASRRLEPDLELTQGAPVITFISAEDTVVAPVVLQSTETASSRPGTCY
jgi:hypothetical protein